MLVLLHFSIACALKTFVLFIFVPCLVWRVLNNMFLAEWRRFWEVDLLLIIVCLPLVVAGFVLAND